MKNRALGVVSLAAFVTLTLSVSAFTYAGALEDYVTKTDPSYSWRVHQTLEGPQSTTFVIDLQSQTWRTDEEVNHPVWKHWLVVVRPKKLTQNEALIYVSNGKSSDAAPSSAHSRWVELAQVTESVVAELFQVPNQPLIYHGDGEERLEDNSVAYSWNQVLKTGDPTWSIRLPMVKSVVAAMDAIQTFMIGPQGGKKTVNKFVIAGGSKRGWTTWLTPVVDKRVIAIVPMVIDVLQVQKSLRHHFEAYGFWAPAIKSYVEQGIASRFFSPAFGELMKLEDPYSYKDEIRVPKYIINASGDQFFLPDSSQFYFDDLKGPKYLRYLPNSDHSMAGTEAFQNLAAFYDRTIHNQKIPQVSWKKKKDGSIEVQTADRPESVVLWHAHNPNARDFRVSTIGKTFQSIPLKRSKNGAYTASIPKPAQGYTAFFIEVTYPGGSQGSRYPLQLTTEVSVIPDTLPFQGKLPETTPEKISQAQKATVP